MGLEDRMQVKQGGKQTAGSFLKKAQSSGGKLVGGSV